MSSMGTVPKSSAKGEGERKLQEGLANCETPPIQEPVPLGGSLNTAVALNDLKRVEKLLLQLEAKSVALIPDGYWISPQAQAKKSHTWLIAVVICCTWLATLVLAIAYFSYQHGSPGAETRVVATPFEILAPPDAQNQKPAESVDHFAKALANSSDRFNKIETALAKSNRELQQLKINIRRGQTTVHTHRPNGTTENNRDHDDSSVVTRVMIPFTSPTSTTLQ